MGIYEYYKRADMMEYGKTEAKLEFFNDRNLNNRKRMCDAKFDCRKMVQRKRSIIHAG